MRRCRVDLTITSSFDFKVDSGEEETADVLLERISEGLVPTWIEELIKRNLNFEQIDIDNYTITGGDPLPDEELNFEE